MSQAGERRFDVEATAYLILRGGLDVREFLRMPHGPERSLILAAIPRAQEMKRDESRELAVFLAQALGAK